jgi:hypothetical protein
VFILRERDRNELLMQIPIAVRQGGGQLRLAVGVGEEDVGVAPIAVARVDASGIAVEAPDAVEHHRHDTAQTSQTIDGPICRSRTEVGEAVDIAAADAILR